MEQRCTCAARYGRPWHRKDCPAYPEAERIAEAKRAWEYACSRMGEAQKALDEAEREYGEAARALQALGVDY